MDRLNVQNFDRRFLKSGLLGLAWLLAGGIVIILMATWPSASHAGAAECRWVFEEASRDARPGAQRRASVGGRYLQHFQGLQERISELRSPEEKIKLALTQNESRLMGREFRSVLRRVVSRIEMNTHVSRNNKENALAGYEATKLLAQEITQSIASFERSGTYEKALQLAVTVTDLGERMQKVMGLDPKDEQGLIKEMAQAFMDLSELNPKTWSKTRNEFLDSLKKRPNVVLVPVARKLTIMDFNEFAGTGIAPLGLVSQSVWVHDRLYSPREFWWHDLFHSWAMSERFNETQAKQWRQLLDAIDTYSGAQREALHAFLYNMSHELSTLRHQFIAAANAPDVVRTEVLKRLLERLMEEDFWGLEALQKEPDLQGFIEKQAKEFVRIVSSVLR